MIVGLKYVTLNKGKEGSFPRGAAGDRAQNKLTKIFFLIINAKCGAAPQ